MRCAHINADQREQRRALYAVLGPRLRDVQYRHAQVAIVLERNFDESLQAWIGQEITPADLGGGQRGAARSGRGALVDLAGGNSAATGAAGRS
jgi:hypothetical protein